MPRTPAGVAATAFARTAGRARSAHPAKPPPEAVTPAIRAAWLGFRSRGVAAAYITGSRAVAMPAHRLAARPAEMVRRRRVRWGGRPGATRAGRVIRGSQGRDAAVMWL